MRIEELFINVVVTTVVGVVIGFVVYMLKKHLELCMNRRMELKNKAHELRLAYLKAERLESAYHEIITVNDLADFDHKFDCLSKTFPRFPVRKIYAGIIAAYQAFKNVKAPDVTYTDGNSSALYSFAAVRSEKLKILIDLL